MVAQATCLSELKRFTIISRDYSMTQQALVADIPDIAECKESDLDIIIIKVERIIKFATAESAKIDKV